MNSITLYHNPRCSKSRQTLELLESRQISPNIVEYLKSPPSKSELKIIWRLLGDSPRILIRTNENLYRELSLDNETLTEDQLVDAIIANPVLLQRPILVVDNLAAIGRPPENVIDILPASNLGGS